MTTTSSKRKSVCIILGTAHGFEVAGKRSPDGKFREYRWSREICKKIIKKLQDDGYRAIIDTEAENEIGLSNRAQIVNNYCGIFGTSKTVYISVHNNAAGSDGKWKTARGWCVFVSKNASDNSKKLASYLAQEVEKNDIKVKRYLPKQDYWQENFTVLKKTKCPAVLTENLFQDNKDDVEILMSAEGKQKFVDIHVAAIERYVDELVEITQNPS